MAFGKIKKVTLEEFNDLNKTWSPIYPKTSGDMVVGRVENARLLDGRETKDFMPSTFSSNMRVISDLAKQTPQGMLVRGLVVTSNYNENEPKMMGNSIWVQGTVKVNNGTLEVATKKYVDEIHGTLTAGGYNATDGKNNSKTGEIYNHLVYRAEKADKLTTPVKINEVSFDGTKDIQIPFYELSDTAPTNKKKLWIKKSTHTIYYYDSSANKWMPTTSVWYEDRNG